MNVLVSGSAARAVFVEGHDVTYIDAEWPETLRKGTTADIALLLANAPDVEELRNVDKNEALARLLELWNRDRALRMLQLVMQPGPDADLSSLAFEYLDGLLQSETVEEYVLDYACAVDLPSAQNLGSDKLFSEAWKNAHRIVSTVIELQDSIREVRRGWESVRDRYFGTLEEANAFEKAAVESGVFKQIVFAHAGRVSVNNAIMASLVAMRATRHSRNVILAWEKYLGVTREKSNGSALVVAADWIASESYSEPHPLGAAEALAQVRRNQSGIVHRLDKGDVANARRFADELIVEQLRTGGQEHAAKSLCALAQEAKKRGYMSLALEWVVRASEVAPADGYAHGQAGDAYLGLYRFADAERSYVLAAAHGEERLVLSAKLDF